MAERFALRALLRQLDAEEWDHPSVCDGWRVRDVAAHVISAPRCAGGDAAGDPEGSGAATTG